MIARATALIDRERGDGQAKRNFIQDEGVRARDSGRTSPPGCRLPSMPPSTPFQGPGDEASVSAAMAAAFLDYAAAHGFRPNEATPGAAPDSDADEATGRLALGRFEEMQREASRQACNPLLLLRFAAEVDPADYSIVGLLMKLSATVAEAAGCLARHGRLLVDLRIQAAQRLRIEPAGADLRVVGTEGQERLIALTFAQLIAGTRGRFGPWVKEVQLRRAAGPHAGEYERIFEAPVVFGSRCDALVGDAARMTASIRRPLAYLRHALAARAEIMLHELDRSKTIAARVERLLVPRLPTGTTTAEQIAAACGVNRRTLHRRLQLEGTTYADLLASVRKRLALYLLLVKRMPVGRVGYELGFSDPAAFSRAFKRWTGLSPSEAAKLPADGEASADWAAVAACGIPSRC